MTDKDSTGGLESQNAADGENMGINGSEAMSDDGDQQKKGRKLSVNSG